MRASARRRAGTLDREQARKFFEDNFKPVRIAPPRPGPTASTPATTRPRSRARAFRPRNSRCRSIAAPADTIEAQAEHGVRATYDRTEIENGALAGKNLEICYVKNPIDAFFAQIQGSTRVKLENGKMLRLNYVASNGQPYTPVGRF